MRKQLALAVGIAALFTVTVSAQAMPVSALNGVSKSDRTITKVAGGCGRGWHRGPRGRCRPN